MTEQYRASDVQVESFAVVICNYFPEASVSLMLKVPDDKVLMLRLMIASGVGTLIGRDRMPESLASAMTQCAEEYDDESIRHLMREIRRLRDEESAVSKVAEQIVRLVEDDLRGIAERN